MYLLGNFKARSTARVAKLLYGYDSEHNIDHLHHISTQLMHKINKIIIIIIIIIIMIIIIIL